MKSVRLLTSGILLLLLTLVSSCSHDGDAYLSVLDPQDIIGHWDVSKVDGGLPDDPRTIEITDDEVLIFRKKELLKWYYYTLLSDGMHVVEHGADVAMVRFVRLTGKTAHVAVDSRSWGQHTLQLQRIEF